MAAFLLDENVSIGIANHLTEWGHEVTSLAHTGYRGLADPDVLLLAQQWQRALITHNRGDFRLLHRAWSVWGEAWNIHQGHAGILILDQPKGLHASAFAQIIVRLITMQPDVTGTLWDWRRNKGWQRVQ